MIPIEKRRELFGQIQPTLFVKILFDKKNFPPEFVAEVALDVFRELNLLKLDNKKSAAKFTAKGRNAKSISKRVRDAMINFRDTGTEGDDTCGEMDYCVTGESYLQALTKDWLGCSKKTYGQSMRAVQWEVSPCEDEAQIRERVSKELGQGAFTGFVLLLRKGYQDALSRRKYERNRKANWRAAKKANVAVACPGGEKEIGRLADNAADVERIAAEIESRYPYKKSGEKLRKRIAEKIKAHSPDEILNGFAAWCELWKTENFTFAPRDVCKWLDDDKFLEKPVAYVKGEKREPPEMCASSCLA